jgi:hypothetical protein
MFWLPCSRGGFFQTGDDSKPGFEHHPYMGVTSNPEFDFPIADHARKRPG